MKTVLIIDDEEKLMTLTTRLISLEGFEVLQAKDGKSAFRKLEQTDVDVVLCDVKLPDANGIELSQKIKAMYPLTEIIMLTAYGNIPDGVQAMKNGAFDYITKGNDNNRIIPLLYRAMEKVELAKKVRALEQRLDKKYSFDTIIGSSKPILQAVDLAKKVAQTDTTVLLTGETGTGKEIFAQAIHQASKRSSHNFVAINCSAFSKDLLESEMFGHKAGAFTGATKDQKGLFEEAHNGTLFLDEIGEMPPELQAKLLRVLETGEFLKVGETKARSVNVRIIAATHRNIPQEITAGNFREDLFYRISVFQIEVPPLRERIADIEALALHFLTHFSAKINKKTTEISQECLEALKLHSWKGNIRELKNVMERSAILSEQAEIGLDSLPLEMQNRQHQAEKGKQLSAFDLASAEKLHIQKVLNYTNGNKTETARLLNIGLTTLYRKVEEYGLSA